MADPYAGLGTPPQGSNSPTQTPSDPYAGLGTPPPQASQRAPGATGLGAIGQTFQDLTNSGPANHAPNSLESGIMGVANSPVVQGLQGAYQGAVTNGLFMQPTRAAMEGLGIGMNTLRAKYPGQSDQWYQQQLHQAYGNAVTDSRQAAAQQVQRNKLPGLGGVAQDVGNFGAGVVGSPEMLAMGGAGTGETVLGRIVSAGMKNAGIGAVSDAAAQGMDMLEGQKKDFDITQNLTQAAMGGVVGAGMHGVSEAAPVVSDYVKGLFLNRGTDTLPSASPLGKTTPITGGKPTPEVAQQIQNAWHTGQEQDIMDAYQGTNIPPPTHEQIHNFVSNRDNPEVTPQNPPPIGEVDQKAAVQQHVDDLTQGWKNAPQINVINHIGEIENPYTLEKALDQNADHPSALGFHDKNTGQSYIFANKMTSPSDVSAVLYHEGLGHFGLQQKFGANLDGLLQTLDNRNVGQFGKAVDQELKNNGSEYGGNRTRAAEEVLANMSEAGPLKPVLADAVESTLRRFGRKMGMDLTYSDAEVRNILAMAHDSVINGNGRNVRDNNFKINRGYQPTDLSDNAAPQPLNHMFTGPSARTFDPADRTAFNTEDGQPRNEISDKSARLTGVRGSTLGTTLDHPALYDQYPELRHTPVVHEQMDGLMGGYDPDTRTIHLNPDDPNPLSTTLHEAQHAVQHIEGHMAAGDGTAHLSDDEYSNHALEREARATEARQGMTTADRANTPINFMKKNALGEELPEPHLLDEADRLKADPRFWSDPAYRKNVIEMGRTKFDPETAKPAEAAAPLRTYAEYQAQQAAKPVDFMKRKDAASSNYVSDNLERVYHSLDEHYTPTTETHEEVLNRALEAGFKPSQIKELGKTSNLSVNLARMQSAANMADARLSALEDRIGTANQKPTDALDYASALADFHYLNARVKGTKADIARALNVAKTAQSYTVASMAQVAERLKAEGSGLANLVDDPIKFMKFVQQIKALRAAGNPAGAHVLMAGVDKPYWEQYLTSFHFNAMLSSLSTHVKAPLDMMTGIAHNVLDHTLAMPVGKMYNFVEGITGRSVKPGVSAEEVQGRILGAVRSVFNHEVWMKGAHAAATGEGSIVQPNGSARPTNASSTYGQASNARFTGAASVLNKPMDLITAQDTIFRSVALGQELHGLGARQAIADFKVQGVKPTSDMIRIAGDAHAFNPTQSMLDEARASAEKSLLLNPNRVTEFLGKLSAYTPYMSPTERIGAFLATNLAPFMRVASNSLITRTIERSPLPLLSPNTWAVLGEGGPEAHLALSKMIYGTVKLGLLWGAADAAKNALTGSGPSNTNKFKELEASGWRPNAVHENGQYNTGGTLNMSLNPFDLHNSTAQMVKDAHDAYDQGKEEGAGKGWMAKAGFVTKAALGTFFHDFEQTSWVHDVAPAIAAADSRGEGAAQTGANFVGQEAKTFVPGALNQVTRLMDPYEHDTHPDNSGDFSGSVVNDIKSAIPGLAETLPIRYSVYGDPLQNGASVTGVHTDVPGLGGNSVSETTDPTKLELQRLAKLSPAAVVTPVQRTVKVTDADGYKMDKKLTTAQFEQYQQLAGVNIVDQVKQLMSDPQWSSTPDKTKIAAVREVQTEVKKAAREQLFGQ